MEIFGAISFKLCTYNSQTYKLRIKLKKIKTLLWKMSLITATGFP